MNERDVFIAALQIESRALRQVYLDEACSGDEPLRLQVAALLATHDRAGNFLQEPLVIPPGAAAALLDQPAGAPLGEAACAPTVPAGDKTPQTPVDRAGLGPPSLRFLAPPQQPDEVGRLGHYRVLRLLGQGGMGMVFLADDTELQRPVALKVMRAELAANPEGRQRFLFEARAAAQVRSDHVVTVYHVDQEGDLPYMVMELLRGQSLAEALEQRGRLPLGLCLSVARETAEGLAAAHACGLIHRDVKPGNVFLESPGPGAVRVKLLDFGLARARSGPSITGLHVILGTPAYMSPEQAAGRLIDGRSDLFSLGAMLYHMLTGQRPFPGDDALVVLSRLADITPPSAASLVPGLPAGVARLLDGLLAKDPAGRPESADEVARTLLALEQDAAGIVPSADKPPAPLNAEASATIRLPTVLPAGRRRRRQLALVCGLGLSGLVIGLLVAALAGAFRGRVGDGPTAVDTATSAPVTHRALLEIPPFRECTLTGHGLQVQALAFTADSKTLVSAEYVGKILFWDIDHRKMTFQMRTAMELQSLAVDPLGRWLAVCNSRPEIRLYRFGDAQEEGQLKGHTDRVTQLAFLKDGRTLLSTGFDGSIRRWDVEKQEQGKPLRDPGRRIDGFAAWEQGSSDLRLAFTSYRGDNYGFVGLLDGGELERLVITPGQVALSPNGARLACSTGENNGVVLWEMGVKNRRLGLLVEAPTPKGLAFTPDGKHLVVVGLVATLIYDMATRQPVAHVDHPEKAVSLAVSPDGRWLAVGTLKGTVRVWHLPSLLAPSG